ncbi:MAG TPA: cellulose synthase subunit BcsC-related outer membrane protein [Acetobacteraceae bacterium]|nr:cellulose synthase subunit BcsC-related outer membrane protein [Acetobacteraceae bacterium]
MKHAPALLTAVALLAAADAAAQVGGTAGNGAMATLLAQGEHWLAQNRPDLALSSFERVLVVEPGNAQALAGAAQAQAARGNRAAADAIVAQLRQQLGSVDPRLGAAESRLREASVDREVLADARRLAEARRTVEAVSRYREAFGGPTPPPGFALEFYQVMAGSDEGWAEARDALGRLVASRPDNTAYALAHARVLTYREATRAEGIAQLQRLAADPATGPAATAAWRQAVVWAGTGRGALPQLEAFVARNPGDTAMAQRLAQARSAPTGEPLPGDAARSRGFAALDASRARDAEREFEAAIAANPRDGDALGGLGVLRLRQGRAAEARNLLERAVAAAPDRAAQWRQALDAAAYATELAEARAQIRAGRTEQAEAPLRQAASRDVADRADAEALLGDILLSRGDAAAAEARFRAALTRRPDFGAALNGLEAALRRQGRTAEAAELARRRPATPGGAASPGAELRAQATRASDPAEAAALLRAALAADPANPWIRLDLARALSRQGRAPEGRALLEDGAARGGAEAAFAAALFAEEEGRMTDAAALLERVPARNRNADMARLLARARGEGEVATAAASLRGPGSFEARNRLLGIAARPDTSGAQAAAVVRAFGTVGDAQGAEEAARVALVRNPTFQPGARLAIAAALLEAGSTEFAQSMLAAAEADPRLGTEERQRLASLQSGIAIRASDRANEGGDQAAGFDRLRPILLRNPQDAPANLALARLYQGARQPAEAARVAEAVLARDPRNLDARATVVDAALAAGDTRRAEAALGEARTLAPREPRLLVLEARVARAQGDMRRAERALQAAAELRRAQTGADRAGPLMSANPAWDNPFRAASSAPAGTPAPRDAVSADIARELAALREEGAVQVLVAPSVRSRSGTAGLDRLEEYATRIEASMSPGALGGRLTASATPVAISAGELRGSDTALARAGFGPGAARPAGNGDASGVGLGLGWQRGAVALDVGTTPLGFRTTNLVGGIEVAPRLTDNLRLRVTGERRAVTDSLASWAGQRDSLGRTFGGVVRTGGRAQLEYTAGPATFYAGGGYAVFEGQNVEDNNRVEAGAGLSYAVFRRPDEELTTGLDLVYLAYDRNQRAFTFGNGGYFSPQSYAAVNLPVDWRGRSGDWSWRLGGTVGYANWREDPVQGFAGSTTSLAGQSQSCATGGARGDLEYALTPQLRLGAGLRYDRAADWNETRGQFYLRYRLD